jgi:LacI family transcriptional regulator
MPVNITDIARLSKSSVTAVSLILNDKPHRYSQATVERIRRVAAEHGYRPNLFARSMRMGRFQTIMMLASPEIDDMYVPATLRMGLYESISQRGFRLGLSYVGVPQFEDEASLPQVLQEWSCDGFILTYRSGPPVKLLRLLDRQGIPHVSLNHLGEHDCAYIDDRGAAQMATRFLIDQGHRRIAYFGNIEQAGKEHYSVSHRQAGYERSMLEAGLEPLVLELPYWNFKETVSDSIKKIQALMDSSSRPTAILAYTKVFMLWAAVVARDRGCVIPRDLSLVCFGEELPYDLGVANTFVELPFYQLGAAAGNMILDKLEQKLGPVSSCALPATLRIGGTTSSPPGREA